MGRPGIKIAAVEAGSFGQRLGFLPGDEILTVNGRPITDELALKFHLAEEHILLELRTPEGSEKQFEIDLSESGNLGVKVEDFRTRTCNNDCLFCFIDQLPPGVRPTLQVKDDDYRLSFLHGNYITLTNVGDLDLDRMIEQALSPLYVSVHATDPDLRTRIMGRRKVDDLDRKIKKLIGGGIRLHTQIVLMPRVNDGSYLEKTVFDLYGYYPGVDSVAIVPLGLSDHGTPRQGLTPVTAHYCREIIRQVDPWQKRFRCETGTTFAYLADEFYIQGGIPLPETRQYDAFAQIEDGIGMVRKSLDEFDSEIKRWRRARPHLDGTLTTAKLFFPFLSSCIQRFNDRFHSRVKVVQIENRFLGKDITVAGLLAGQDILSGLETVSPGNFVIIPSEAISRIDGNLLDDLSPRELERRLGVPVYPGGRSMRDLFVLLCQKLQECGTRNAECGM